MLASKGAKLFNVGLASITLNPVGVIVMAILCNTIILFVSYQIARDFLENKTAFALIIIVGLVANSPLVGFHDNELIFTRKTVTVALILISFLCYFRERYIVGGLIAAGALFLHPINALAALVFFLPGFVFYVCRRRTEKLPLLIFSLIAPLLIIGITYISRLDLTESTLHISVTEWYRYSLLLEADDVTMMWKIREGAPHLIPLLVSSFVIGIIFTFKRGIHLDSALSWICITQLPLVLLILTFELLQLQGFNLGVVSELFSSIQLRRGIWVPMLFSILLFCIYISSLPKNTRTMCILSVIVATVLDHTPFSILIALVTLLFLLRDRAFIFPFLCSIAGVGWYIAVNAAGLIDISHVKHLFLFVGLLSIFILGQKIKGAQVAFVSVLLVHSLILLVNNNIRHQVFLDSYHYLVSPEEIRNQQTKEELEVLVALNKFDNQTNSTVLFAPIGLGYGASIISRRPLLFSRWDNTLIFSKTLYGRFVEKMSDLGVPLSVCDMGHDSNMGCVLEEISQKIDILDEGQILHLADKYNIGYIVRRTTLSGRTPIFTNSSFSVYQL
jgi:hypothetical protein